MYCLLAALALFSIYRPPGDLKAAASNSPTRLAGPEWRLILSAGVAWGVFNAGYVAYLSFGPKVLEAQGYTALAAAGVISVASWLMIFSGALCGQIADRFGRRNTILTVCMTSAVLSIPAGRAGRGSRGEPVVRSCWDGASRCDRGPCR